jgi:hypothetical protein
MYTLSMPVSQLRTKMRQEFERHRYVNQMKTVDVLLFNSHQEYQVRPPAPTPRPPRAECEGIDAGTGNAQLLEAAVARAQVLPRRGGARRAVAEQLHQRLLGGMFTGSCGYVVGDRLTTIGSQRLKRTAREDIRDVYITDRQYHFLSPYKRRSFP